MKLHFLTVMLVSLLVASCGSSEGPAKIVSPPVEPPPPTGGTQPPPTPRVPGFGNNGKLSINVEEGGSVSTSPDVGTCNGHATCDFNVDRGTIVTLRARPNTGWVFEEWDHCSGPSGTLCVETIEALTYVKAEFDRAP